MLLKTASDRLRSSPGMRNASACLKEHPGIERGRPAV